jgi:hybrid cluster-associated redox disulfide protein
MNTQILPAQMTVEDILKKWPQAYAIFNTRNTACVGCMLQRFCTLQDVAETYLISLSDLVVDLENYVNGNSQQMRSNP